MKTLTALRRRFRTLARALNRFGMLACLVSVIAVTVDVALRKLSGAAVSIPGSGELSAYLLVALCMFAIPACQANGGHVWVSLLVGRVPLRGRERLLGAVRAVESLVCALLTWGGFRKTAMFLETGTTTDVLNLPKWPFALLCLLCFAEMAVLLGLDACLLFGGGAEGQTETPEPNREREETL